MPFLRSTDDLVRIAVAGGGLVLGSTGKSTEDLVRIAVAASNRGARLTIAAGTMSVDELVQIAVAGQGVVQFTFD